ncbi:MAG: DUF5666 domain-containing protein [Patescibacteria group bacterium]|nr:DUF5666 domain-containing protein [Patescibacteria group bacterium]
MLQKDKNTIIPLILAVFIIAIFTSFFGGMYYSKSNTSQDKTKAFQVSSDQFAQNSTRAKGFGRMQGDRPVSGKVTTISGKSVTISLQNNNETKTVMIADNTNITDNGIDATLENIKVGDTLMVIGQTNADGSVKAQLIKINPTSSNVSQ